LTVATGKTLEFFETCERSDDGKLPVAGIVGDALRSYFGGKARVDPSPLVSAGLVAVFDRNYVAEVQRISDETLAVIAPIVARMGAITASGRTESIATCSPLSSRDPKARKTDRLRRRERRFPDKGRWDVGSTG
jgi:hypothetical protein